MKRIIFFLILPLASAAQTDYRALTGKYMEAAVKFNEFNGCVLIARSGKIEYQKSFGYRDFKSTELLTNQSLFDIGRMSEAFTGAAIMLLKQRGKLKLSDPVTKYLPALPYNNITIRHLLTHTSGLPDYYEIMRDKWIGNKMASNNDIIKYLAEAKAALLFQPGERYEDSYTNYPLLASIIEKVSGQDYTAFMQKNIFTPLQLKHTRVLLLLQGEKKEYPGHTEGVPYQEKEQKFVPADSVKGSFSKIDYITEGIAGGSNISSTTGDLLLWDRALKNNKLLTSLTQAEMFFPEVLIDTASKISLSYGGLWVGRNEIGNYIQSYDGSHTAIGYSGTLIRYTEKDITLIVLTNKTKGSSMVSGPLAYIMFDREIILPYIHKEVTIDSAILDRYTGLYASPNSIEIIKKNGKLYRSWTWTGEPDLEFRPESTTKFFSVSKEYDHQIEFETDDDGKITKAYYIVGGIKKEMKKTD